MEGKFIDQLSRTFSVELERQESFKEYLLGSEEVTGLISEIDEWSEDLSETQYYSTEGGKPWLEVTSNTNDHTQVLHFFNEGGEYLRSVDGIVSRGRWRLLDSTNKMIIEAKSGGGGGGGGSNKNSGGNRNNNRNSGGGGGGGGNKNSGGSSKGGGGGPGELYELLFLDSNFFILRRHGTDKVLAMGVEKKVAGLSWRDYVELLANTYRERKQNYWTFIIIILLIAVVAAILSFY